MRLKKRLTVNRSVLTPRSKIIDGFFGLAHWKSVILTFTMRKVCGATDDDDNNNDDYYSYYSSGNNDDYTAEYDAMEEELVKEMIVDEWYDLVRYLVGLGLCIFSLIGLYFHQFASYKFVKKYTKPRETERRVGRVVSCEPILNSTSISDRRDKTKRKKANKKKGKHLGVSVRTFKGEGGGENRSATNYIREEDLELPQSKTGEFTDYRMLVVYKVPKPPSASLLCCGPSEKNLAIHCTNSFSVATCASGVSGVSESDSVFEKINTYRTRSLPPRTLIRNCSSYNELSEKLSGSMEYMHWYDECEYFQWFETSTSKPIDSEIDLILLKGQPTSACTLEVLKSHLDQVGKAHEGEEENKCCKSISMLGTGLAIAVIVLSLVCFFEIQAMPHPETQRPLGYTVLGAFFAGSNVSAYLFAKLLFEQYKQKVFLSAFTVPFTTAYVTKTISQDTNIIDEEFLLQQQQMQRRQHGEYI